MALIDPLKAFDGGIPKMEETNIYVNLRVKTRGRSIIEDKEGGGLTIESRKGVEGVEVNFLGFDEKTKAFTTNWSEISGPHTSGNEPEGFGITSINIDVNTSYIPKVTISFVDIRGSSLFNVGANSKYAVLFQFPPPEFELTIKGYFGKSLTYLLHLLKQNTKFNSKSGNFEITAEFIAVTFAPLADIPVAYIKAAPFMARRSKTIKDVPNPQDSNNIDTIYELIIASKSLNKEVQKIKQESPDYKSLIEHKDKIDKLNRELNTLKNLKNLFEEQSFNIEKTKITITDVGFDDSSGIYKLTTDFLSTGETKNIPEFGSKLKKELSFIIGEDISKNITINAKSGTLLELSERKSSYWIAFINVKKRINSIMGELTKYRNLRNKKCRNVQNEIKGKLGKTLGFLPSIYNIFKIICDNTDIFIDLLIQYSERAQNDEGKLLKNPKLERNAKDTKISDKSNIRFAWPEVIKSTGNKTTKVYPGELFSRDEMPEIDFVETFIESSIDIAQLDLTQTFIDESKDEAGKQIWFPLGPFEDLTISTDYDVTQISDILGALVKRTIIFQGFIDQMFMTENQIESYGKLEGRNIIDRIRDEKILGYFKGLNLDDIDKILKEDEVDQDITLGFDDTAFDILNDINIQEINFRHGGNYLFSISGLTKSVIEIKNGLNRTPEEPTNEFIKILNISDWLEGIFDFFSKGNIQVTERNEFYFPDMRRKDEEGESDFFTKEKSIKSFGLPSILSVEDKVNKKLNISDTKELLKQGRINFYSIFLHKILQNAETFLFYSYGGTVLGTRATGSVTVDEKIRAEITDKFFAGSRTNTLFLNKNTNSFKITDKYKTLPGIMEIPFIVCAGWGWIISIIDNDPVSTLLNDFNIDRNIFFKHLNIKENELKDLPEITKKVFRDQFIDFKNNFEDLVRNKIILDPNNSIWELDPEFFITEPDDKKNEDLTLDDFEEWGKIKEGTDIWDNIYEQRYVFIGTPLAFTTRKEIENKYFFDDNGQLLLNKNKFDTDKKLLKLIIKSALQYVKDNSKTKIEELEKTKKDILSRLNDNKAKLSLYLSFKSIYDRWLSGDFAPFGRRTKKSNLSDDKLISRFRFVDRVMRDVGVKPESGKFNTGTENNNESMIINFNKIENINDNASMSLLTLIELLLVNNGFQFFPLQNFMLFDSGNWDIQSIFGINTNIIGDIKQAPMFLCVYIDSTSSFLDLKLNESDDLYKDSGFNFKDTTLPDDFREDQKDPNSGLQVNAFSVKYGDPNQSMFKDIALDQAEFKETIESIKILDNISQLGSSDVDAKTQLQGQNLFNTYEQRSYSCEVEMLGNVMIQPTQYFNLENIPMFHGAYMIIQVNHSIVPNHMITKFKGVRIATNRLPIVTDYATAIGFDLCDDSVFGEGSSTGESPVKGVIDINKINNSNGLYVQSGSVGKYYVIDMNKGVAGDKLLEFMKDLQKFLGNSATLGNNGITRDLESVVAGGPSRSKTSKHGAGLAIDLLISTDDVNYKDLGWPLANKELVKNKNLMIKINQFVLTDSKYKDLIKWGGHFKNGRQEKITESLSVRIDEIHHFEIKDNKMEQFFSNNNKDKIKKLGIKVPTKQKELALLYSFPFDSKPTSKDKFNQQIIDSGTGDDGIGDGIDYNNA